MYYILFYLIYIFMYYYFSIHRKVPTRHVCLKIYDEVKELWQILKMASKSNKILAKCWY